MIARLIEYVAKNRFLVVLVTVIITLWALYAAYNLAVDAIPDLSDVQVIIYTEYAEQAPQIVEDQVTYPLATAMLAVPRAKVVRGYSQFGALLRLRHLRGRHRHLLGPFPGAGVPQLRTGEAAGRASPRPWAPTPPGWAGSSNTWWKTPPAATTWPNSGASRTGTCATSSKGCRGWRRWPPSAALSNSTRWW